MIKTDVTENAQSLPNEPDLSFLDENAVIEMSGKEMQRVLLQCGFTYSDFARFLGRSNTFVNRSLRYSLVLAPRYVQELQNMVTTDNLKEALYRIRTGTYRKYLTGSEMRALIKRQGYSFKDVADFIGRTGPYVSDVLGQKRYSIPLRYIDALRNLFTPMYYDSVLKKMREETKRK